MSKIPRPPKWMRRTMDVPLTDKVAERKLDLSYEFRLLGPHNFDLLRSYCRALNNFSYSGIDHLNKSETEWRGVEKQYTSFRVTKENSRILLSKRLIFSGQIIYDKDEFIRQSKLTEEKDDVISITGFLDWNTSLANVTKLCEFVFSVTPKNSEYRMAIDNAYNFENFQDINCKIYFVF